VDRLGEVRAIGTTLRCSIKPQPSTRSSWSTLADVTMPSERVPAEEARLILAGLPQEAWQTVVWREGAKGALAKQFVRVRVYCSGLRGKHHPTPAWLIGERPPPGHQGERKYYLARGLDELSLEELVDLAHHRWVIERFYQDAKGELGLDDYEGRLWTGLHRHVAVVMLAHSYLTLRQCYRPEILPPNLEQEPSGQERRRRSFPPPNRRSMAALRREVIEELFLQVIESLVRARAGPHRN
jgi:SRSO17 transposase